MNWLVIEYEILFIFCHGFCNEIYRVLSLKRVSETQLSNVASVTIFCYKYQHYNLPQQDVFTRIRLSCLFQRSTHPRKKLEPKKKCVHGMSRIMKPNFYMHDTM